MITKTVIVPKGVFEHHLGEQVIDDSAIERIVERLKEWNHDIVVDYMHHSMNQCGNGEAAGWVKNGTAKVTEEGILADIEWTKEAERLLNERAYRFLSPVFEAKDGQIIGLLNLGLTNNPNIHVMSPLMNQLKTEEIEMGKEECVKLKNVLGLSETAQNAEVLAEVEKLVNERDQKPTLSVLMGDDIALLGLTPSASDDEVIEKVKELSKESAQERDGAVERMVNDAVSSGKLRPSLKSWAEKLGRQDSESLRLFLVNSGPQVPLGAMMTKESVTPAEKLTENEKSVCKALCVTPEDFIKYGN